MAVSYFASRARELLRSPTFFGENIRCAEPTVEIKKIDKHLRSSYFCFGSNILLVSCDVCFSIKAERVNLSFQYIFFLALLLLSLQLKVLVIALEMYTLPTKLLPRERLRIRAPPRTSSRLIVSPSPPKLTHNLTSPISPKNGRTCIMIHP